MKNWCLVLLLFFSISGNAQNWQTDFEVALAKASADAKPILLVFSGSDWCAPCIKLDMAIWQSQEFQEHASNNYVLYKADFPRKKKNKLPQGVIEQNKALAEQYNPNGYFPLVLVLDEKGEVLGTTGYQEMSPNTYIQLLDSFYQ